ncbi:MAG: hypothetical protein HOV68_32110 [Streptomycetaceae bacterium]|nr:hypothetical protein [Streptomycetaceae bacterium]
MGASTTAKRATPRRAPARKNPSKTDAKDTGPAGRALAPITAEGGFEPIRIVTPETPPEVELVELFSIDGQAYFVPRDPSPAVALRFIRAAQVAGMELALAELLVEMLGEEAYEALASCDAMTAAQFGAIMQGLRQLSMGALEGPKGSSRSA